MKKLISLALCAVLAVSLAACGGKSGGYKIGIPADATNGGRALQLLGQRGHDRLLFRQDFCVRHSCFHLR